MLGSFISEVTTEHQHRKRMIILEVAKLVNLHFLKEVQPGMIWKVVWSGAMTCRRRCGLEP